MAESGREAKSATSDRGTWSSPNAQTTVVQSRVPIFLPIGKITHNSRARDPDRPAKIRVETPWGWAELEGPPLIQTHRDILIACWVLGEKSLRKWDDGSVSVWVNLHELENLLGRRHGGENRKELLGYIKDLRDVSLTVGDRNGRHKMTAGILYRYGYDEDGEIGKRETGKGRVGGENADRLYEIRYSAEYMRFFRMDLRINMARAVPKYLAVSSPLLRALILFFFSHKGACSFPLDTVLKTIGALPEGLARSTASGIRASVRKQEEILGKFGIRFEAGDVLRYEKKHPDVFFSTTDPADLEKYCREPVPAMTTEGPASTGAVFGENPEQEPKS